MRDLFLKRSSSIFVKLGFLDWVGGLFTAKWSTVGKQRGLEGVLNQAIPGFASTPMSALGQVTRAKVMIPAFEYERQRGVYFRSYTSAAHQDPCNTTLLDAINASSTAPVAFFNAPAKAQDGTLYWDGAISGYNNPVMAGIVEALTLADPANPAHSVQPREIVALAIGTGTHRLLPPHIQPPAQSPFVAGDEKPSALADLKKLAGSITDDPPDAASYTAHVLLGNDPAANPPLGAPPSSVVRLSVCIQPKLDGATGQWGPPAPLTTPDFVQLGKLQLDAVGDQDLRLLEKAGLLWLAGDVQNQPIRPDGQMRSQIGHDRFADGHGAWRVLAGLPPLAPPMPVTRP